MDGVVLASIIGAAATVSAPLVTLGVQALMRRRRRSPISKERREALGGPWVGTVSYDSPSTLESHDLTLSIIPHSRTITGHATYRADDALTSLDAKGWFVNDDLMRVEYENQSPAIRHFGVLLVRLNATADRLDGRFVSYGRVSEQIGTGTVTLAK